MKKIIEIIDRYRYWEEREERNEMAEDDYIDKMSCVENIIKDIQTIAKQPKKQKYCNFTIEEHSNSNEVYSTWDLDSITKGAKWTVYNSRVDAEEHGNDCCSIPMNDFYEKI